MPKVINTSANVKPGLIVLFSAAQNGSIPAPIPVKELKLLCPPPEKPCHYCVFHNSISFFSYFIDFYCFLYLRKKYLFSQARSHSVPAIVSKTYIAFLSCFHLLFYYKLFCIKINILNKSKQTYKSLFWDLPDFKSFINSSDNIYSFHIGIVCLKPALEFFFKRFCGRT